MVPTVVAVYKFVSVVFVLFTAFLIPVSSYPNHEKGNYPRNLSGNMVDPNRVVSYEDMLKVIKQPQKIVIDVRNPNEIQETGKIPSSINIPLGNIKSALTSLSDEDFRKQFKREKPVSSDELIFYCRSGRRSSEALDTALKLGYTNSKNYLGSWEEWSRKQPQ